MIRKTFLVIFVFLLFYFSTILPGYGAFEEKGAGARPMGMAGAFTGVADDVNAIYWNPAGLELVKEVEAMGMTTRLFGLKDLTYYLFGGVVPTKKIGAFGLSYSQFGCSEYRESQIIFSSGQSLGSEVCFGFNVKIMSIKIKGASANSEYGRASAFGLDVGALADIGSKFRLGVMATNLNGPRLGNCSETLAQRIMVGTSFRIISRCITSLDLHLPLSSIMVEPEVRAGVEVILSRNFTLRAGVEDDPTRFTGGFGLRWKIFKFDYAFLSHPFLNNQHQFSFSLHLGNQTIEN
ncbi:MAG: hypothetical protein ACETVO_04580 [bacterium]